MTDGPFKTLKTKIIQPRLKFTIRWKQMTLLAFENIISVPNRPTNVLKSRYDKPSESKRMIASHKSYCKTSFAHKRLRITQPHDARKRRDNFLLKTRQMTTVLRTGQDKKRTSRRSERLHHVAIVNSSRRVTTPILGLGLVH